MGKPFEPDVKETSDGVGSSDDELEGTHNPLDLEDIDKILDEIEQHASDGDDDKEEPKKDEDNKEEEEEEDEPDGEDDDKQKTVPYDRFKSVIDEKNRYKDEFLEMKRRLDEIESRVKSGDDDTGSKEETPPLEDILSLEDEQEILDAFQEDPKGFISGLLDRAKYELKQEVETVESEKEYYDTLKKNLDDFAEKHDGFIEFATSDKAIDYIREHPEHNAVSAYLVEEYIPKAIKQAKEEGRREAINYLKTKGHASVLDGGSGLGDGGHYDVDDDLKETDKHGGLREVLVNRLKAAREAR